MAAHPPSLPVVAEPEPLEYSVFACSSYSGQYVPENILVDDPTDQRSRWSGGSGFTSINTLLGSNNGNGAQQNSASARSTPVTSTGATLPSGGPARERQWLVLKLTRPAVLRRITFGKYTRSHPCNVKEFKVYAGMSPDINTMSLVYWGGLKNDATPETFDVASSNRQGILRPTEYICVEPLSAHSSNYNISIWHISLAGNNDDGLMETVTLAYNNHCEDYTSKLVLKHLRQRGLMTAFDALRSSLPSTSSLRLEHPSVTELHKHLVQEGDFDATENLLANIAFPTSTPATQSGTASSLFDPYCNSASPRIAWTRLDNLQETTNWDGEKPSARGGHQMVLVTDTCDTDQTMETSSQSGESSASSSSLYVFGGWNGTAELADLWRFDLRDKRWYLLSNNTGSASYVDDTQETCVGPGPRSCHQMAVDVNTDDVYMLGRYIDRKGPVAAAQGDEGRQWVSSQPSYRGDGQAISQETSNVSQQGLLSGLPQADFWILHTRGSKRGQWKLLSSDTQADGGPPLIFDHQMQIDPIARKLYVFGGKYYENTHSGPGSPAFSGLYSYDIASKTWQHIAADVDPASVNWYARDHKAIPSRTGHSMLCDTSGRKLLILAGQRSDLYMSDLWSYCLDKGTIECIDKDYGMRGGPDGGFTQRAVMVTHRREFVLLSGLIKEKTPPHYTQVKNTIWVYGLEHHVWQKIDRDTKPELVDSDWTGPRPRFAHQFVYDSDQDEYYLFGGNPADATISARLDDFWHLKLARITKDEVLRSCKFHVRRCKFLELCNAAAHIEDLGDQDESPFVEALLYLQTSLADVVDSDSQAAFLGCMSYLLTARQQGANGALSSRPQPSSDAPAVNVMTKSGLVSVPEESWKRRSEVFERLLAFFPEKERQPMADLLSCTSAWEAAL